MTTADELQARLDEALKFADKFLPNRGDGKSITGYIATLATYAREQEQRVEHLEISEVRHQDEKRVMSDRIADLVAERDRLQKECDKRGETIRNIDHNKNLVCGERDRALEALSAILHGGAMVIKTPDESTERAVYKYIIDHVGWQYEKCIDAKAVIALVTVALTPNEAPKHKHFGNAGDSNK